MKEKECTCPIFRALKKKGLRWNPETGVIEVNRLWRARLGEIYFFINSNEDEAQKYADEFKRILQGRTLDKEE